MTLRPHDRLPAALLVLLGAICVATLWNPPAGRVSWALEVVPGLILVAYVAFRHRTRPMSHLVHVVIFLHVLILIYGGIYTYALTPLGNWARDTFHLARNHYDRVGHVALGLFPTLFCREILLRHTPLRRGGWLCFVTLSIVFAFGAFWELLEWWVTLIVASDTGTAFLGSQGDVWDAQWDMALVGAGSIVSLLFLQKTHDRSMATVPLTESAGESPAAVR
ncbi:MAG: DUF2238 domain-containing protein [Proteobacteria bacterium]|nr:MAG: DUF2238 domain-containing protein [Pseudomonadota bacterium]